MLTCKMTSSARRRPDKAVVLFDCLDDKNAEAVDAFSLFNYLKQNQVPAKYFILQDNRLCLKLADDKDVIPLNDASELLSRYSGVIAGASHIIAGHGLKTTPYEDEIFQSLPICECIVMGPDVIYLQKWMAELYSPGFFDKILVASPKTRDLYLELGIWDARDMLCCGMPRWDGLRREAHARKNILLFCTWRRSFEKDPAEIVRYADRLQEFVRNERLQAMLADHDITLNMTLHHSLLFNQLNIGQLAKVKIIPADEISAVIKITDLLITDYSSRFFDCMYLDIPVIFYRFDADVEYTAHEDLEALRECRKKDAEGYNCFENADKVLEKIDFYIKNDFTLEKEYRRINESFFWEEHTACAKLLEYIQAGQCGNPAVSVIMPVYNTAKYLPQSIAGLLKQTFTDFELICVDDGSTDNSLEILRYYAIEHRNIKIIHKQRNTGAGDSRNVGCKASRGKYVIWLDSDDVFEPDLLEKLYAQITAKNADICMYAFDRFDETTNEHTGTGSLVTKALPAKNPFSYKDVPKKIFTITDPNTVNKLYKKSFIAKYNFEYMTTRTCNDIYFNFATLIAARKITWVNEILLHYRYAHTNSLTHIRAEHAACVVEAYAKVQEFCEKLKIFHRVQRSFYVRVVSSFCYEFALCNREQKLALLQLFEQFLPQEHWKVFLEKIDGINPTVC